MPGTRINAVSFLNTRPLVYSLENKIIPHQFELMYDVPSVCARQIRNGDADAGVIPSIAYARAQTPYAIVPDIAIGSCGPVNSIFLFHTVPVQQIETVAVDISSRTSVALTQIILRERYGCRITLVDHPPDLDRMLTDHHAALIIGDPALEYAERPEPHLDLGREWTNMTGLPFVYAFWAGPEGRLDSEEVQILTAAKNHGMTVLDVIASEYADTHPRDASFYESYLRENLRYGLGRDEIEGLSAFYKRAYQYELINAVPDLRFF